MSAVKYELIQEGDFFRLLAVKDFGIVRAGDRGGLVAGPDNLAHEGTCWVHGGAIVYEEARVFGRAVVYGEARVFGSAVVHDEAVICGNARVSGEARVFGNAQISGNAQVYGWAVVYGDALVYGEAQVDYKVPVISGLPRQPITILRERVNIGCESHSIACWIENVYEIGAHHGHQPHHIEIYRQILETVFKMQEAIFYE